MENFSHPLVSFCFLDRVLSCGFLTLMGGTGAGGSEVSVCFSWLSFLVEVGPGLMSMSTLLVQDTMSRGWDSKGLWTAVGGLEPWKFKLGPVVGRVTSVYIPPGAGWGLPDRRPMGRPSPPQLVIWVCWVRPTFQIFRQSWPAGPIGIPTMRHIKSNFIVAHVQPEVQDPDVDEQELLE